MTARKNSIFSKGTKIQTPYCAGRTATVQKSLYIATNQGLRNVTHKQEKKIY